LILREAPQLNKLRSQLCPKFLEDNVFWYIYFELASKQTKMNEETNKHKRKQTNINANNQTQTNKQIHTNTNTNTGNRIGKVLEEFSDAKSVELDWKELLDVLKSQKEQPKKKGQSKESPI